MNHSHGDVRVPERVTIGPCTLLYGDSRQLMPSVGLVDALLCDPPYGETSLVWDRRVDGWLDAARPTLAAHGSLWCFGSLRFFMAAAAAGHFAGWTFVQDVVWEKHNGSSFHADRFKRVHEHVVQFYPAGVRWEAVYKQPVTTLDATRRTVRRKGRPPHMGHIQDGRYASEDGGPRLMRSVIYARSCHGYALHETQKPVDVITPLLRYSVPAGGVVGDWFMGSGSVAVAALQVDVRYVGCEIDPHMFALACQRVQRAYEGGRQLALPALEASMTGAAR